MANLTPSAIFRIPKHSVRLPPKRSPSTSKSVMSYQHGRPLPPADDAFRISENRNIPLEDVCTSAANTAGDAEAALALGGGKGRWETVWATGETAHHLEEMQLVTGQGPVVESMSSGAPVFAADFAQPTSRSRWPAFAPMALETAGRAAFAFPLRGSRSWVGTLSVYRVEPGELSSAQSADILRLAASAFRLLTSSFVPNHAEPKGDNAWSAPTPADPNHDPALIYQATGVLAARKGVDIDTAFAILRAEAYTTGRRLVSVAKATIETYLPLDEGAQIR
jgi:hypothetical protein